MMDANGARELLAYKIFDSFSDIEKVELSKVIIKISNAIERQEIYCNCTELTKSKVITFLELKGYKIDLLTNNNGQSYRRISWK